MNLLTDFFGKNFFTNTSLRLLWTICMELEHSRLQILWVRASWSLPLNLKLLSDVYFHIKSKKLAPLVLFLSHETCEVFLSRILKCKQNGEQEFLDFGQQIETIFGHIHLVWKVFLIDFQGKMKFQKTWQDFKVI